MWRHCPDENIDPSVFTKFYDDRNLWDFALLDSQLLPCHVDRLSFARSLPYEPPASMERWFWWICQNIRLQDNTDIPGPRNPANWATVTEWELMSLYQNEYDTDELMASMLQSGPFFSTSLSYSRRWIKAVWDGSEELIGHFSLILWRIIITDGNRRLAALKLIREQTIDQNPWDNDTIKVESGAQRIQSINWKRLRELMHPVVSISNGEFLRTALNRRLCGAISNPWEFIIQEPDNEKRTWYNFYNWLKAEQQAFHKDWLPHTWKKIPKK